MPIQIWSLADIASFKLILGFAMELLSDADQGLPVGMVHRRKMDGSRGMYGLAEKLCIATRRCRRKEP